MALQEKSRLPKKRLPKVSFDFKVFVIDEIKSGQISIRHAAKKYIITKEDIVHCKMMTSALAHTNQRHTYKSYKKPKSKLPEQQEEH